MSDARHDETDAINDNQIAFANEQAKRIVNNRSDDMESSFNTSSNQTSEMESDVSSETHEVTSSSAGSDVTSSSSSEEEDLTD